MNRLAVHAIALVVVDLGDRRVDRDLVKVRTTQPRDLGIDVGVNAAGQQRIVREVDAWNHVRDAERHLLGLGEEVVRIAVEDEPADRDDGHQLLGHDLGRVEHVEREALGLFLGEDLQTQLVFGIGPGLDRLPEIAAVKVRVRARNLDRFIPDQRVRPGLRAPVELDELRLAPRR